MLAHPWKDPSRALAPWTLAVLLGGCLGCGLTEPPPDSKPLVKGPEAVRDAVALAMENKDRCLEVGRGGAERMVEESLEYQRNPGSPSPEKSFRHYVEVEAAPDLAAASEMTKTIDRLLPLVKKEASPDLAQAVEERARAQRVICIRAEERGLTPASYEDQISQAVYDYESALAAVEARFTITPGDRALTVARYRSAAQDAPDRKVGGALETAYKELQKAARACLASHPVEVHFRLQDGEAALARAASLLEPYSLRP